jgi:zinc protease
MVNVGSLHDYKKQYGLAHFTEHFLFRSKIEDSSEYVDDILRSYGGEINAGTSSTYTKFYILSHKNDASQAIQYLAKIVCDLNIDNTLFSQEKEIILEEMGYGRGFPTFFWSNSKLTLLGVPKGYHHPTIGSRYSLDNIDITHVQKFYNEFYTPKNMVLSIVGNFDKEEMKAQIDKYFLKLPEPRSDFLKKIDFQIKGPKIKTRNDIWSDSFTMYFVTKAFNNADLPAAELLIQYIDLLMYRNFRIKKEQIYYLDCDLDYNYNIGCFDFDFYCRHKKVKRVMLDFLKDLKWIKQKGMEEKMLETIKDKLIKQQLINFEDVLYAANWYSYRELLTSRTNPNDFESYLKAFNDISSESIRDFARRLFSHENFFLDYSGILTSKMKQRILDLIE